MWVVTYLMIRWANAKGEGTSGLESFNESLGKSCSSPFHKPSYSFQKESVWIATASTDELGKLSFRTYYIEHTASRLGNLDIVGGTDSQATNDLAQASRQHLPCMQSEHAGMRWLPARKDC